MTTSSDSPSHPTVAAQPDESAPGAGFAVKRIYSAPASGDGYRVLVDRLWARGLTKDKAAVDEWLKDIAPSNDLRRWYGHDPAKWSEFRRRYAAELAAVDDIWRPLLDRAKRERVTLLYSSTETEINNAVALREFLQAQ
jgi:uncharacterized protein YeaO (DUF488 family)